MGSPDAVSGAIETASGESALEESADAGGHTLRKARRDGNDSERSSDHGTRATLDM
jgi:hypothetical protein